MYSCPAIHPTLRPPFPFKTCAIWSAVWFAIACALVGGHRPETNARPAPPAPSMPQVLAAPIRRRHFSRFRSRGDGSTSRRRNRSPPCRCPRHGRRRRPTPSSRVRRCSAPRSRATSVAITTVATITGGGDEHDLDDHRRLVELRAALQVPKRALSRDDCGDWMILGRAGHIYREGAGFQIFVSGRSARHWNNLKRSLAILPRRDRWRQ